MKDIIIRGAETNNLKKVTVNLRKNAINLIVGPSGSGKSSLAYDTIAQIGLHELGSMYYDGVKEPEYKVDSYENILVTVPIKQMNNNNNVRSTIGTYFSLNSNISKIFSSLLDLPYDLFVLNKTENVCPHCLGLGYTKQLDANKIIDFNKKIADVPIRCWNRNKDFYRQILESYCADVGINTSLKFKQLSDNQKHLLLEGSGTKKYTIKYKVTNHYCTRTTSYYGPLTEKPMLKNFAPSSKFYSELPCTECHGEKFESGHKKYKICGYSVGEVLLLSFDKLHEWTSLVRKQYDCKNIDFSLTQLETFAQKASELKVGYLFMNRNIPSLSGGELQRLRLIQVFATQLTDLLIVLDEPLAGLSTDEKKIVYKNVKALEKKHTLLIIDHHDMFVKDAAQIIALGEGSGKKGGNIINASKYLEKQNKKYVLKPRTEEATITVSLSGRIYGYTGVDISFGKSTLNIISGKSGVGKSTVLREYLPRYFDNYEYINQKPLEGNSHSFVATNLGILERISKCFAKNCKKDKSLFSNMSSASGACRTCGGTGLITYGSELQSQIVLKCKDCRGTGVDKKIQNYQIKGKSILDIWEMTIDEAIDYFEDVEKTVCEILRTAQKLMLGHLQIGERISSLSGGENIRIKLVSALKGKSDVYGIDEPFKGLDNSEIFVVAKALAELCEQDKTVIVVDHEEESFAFFARHIELQNNEGYLVGKVIK